MNCVKCEVMRAKIRATIGFNVGNELSEIAETLSSIYGTSYYVEGYKVFRSTSTPPYKPILIFEV